jgi:hypothetical protein
MCKLIKKNPTCIQSRHPTHLSFFHFLSIFFHISFAFVFLKKLLLSITLSHKHICEVVLASDLVEQQLTSPFTSVWFLFFFNALNPIQGHHSSCRMACCACANAMNAWKRQDKNRNMAVRQCKSYCQIISGVLNQAEEILTTPEITLRM